MNDSGSFCRTLAGLFGRIKKQSSLPVRRQHLLAERLEDRCVPANYDWVGGTADPIDGREYWGERKNWRHTDDRGERVTGTPGENDAVFIGNHKFAGAGRVAIVGGQNMSVGSVAISGGGLTIFAGGSLVVANGAVLGGDFLGVEGRLQVNGQITTLGEGVRNKGRIEAQGIIVAAGTFFEEGGYVDAPVVRVLAGATLRGNGVIQGSILRLFAFLCG